jgi:hypothetical protein
VDAPKARNCDGSKGNNQRPRRKKDQLIQLDDLIPKQDVKGGRQLLFGATHTTQNLHNPSKES